MDDINLVLLKRKQQRELTLQKHEKIKRDKFEREKKREDKKNEAEDKSDNKYDLFYKSLFAKLKEEDLPNQTQVSKKEWKIKENKNKIENKTNPKKEELKNQKLKGKPKRKYRITKAGQPKLGYQIHQILNKIKK